MTLTRLSTGFSEQLDESLGMRPCFQSPLPTPSCMLEEKKQPLIIALLLLFHKDTDTAKFQSTFECFHLCFTMAAAEVKVTLLLPVKGLAVETGNKAMWGIICMCTL